jgi:GNAT superfamily N-acetyltransferase
MDKSKIEIFEDDALAALIREKLDEFNFALVPHYDHKLLNLVIKEGTEVQAGLLAGTYWGWLYISILWVSEHLRGQGLGTQLLKHAEAIALERGCRHAHLETHDFQALGFYQRHGYDIFGQLEDLRKAMLSISCKKTS